MSSPGPERETASPVAGKRGLSVAIGAAVVIGLFALALIFANAHSARLVATNARALHWTNATLGAAGISRASNAQAVFFALDHQLGVASAEARQAALEEAKTNLGHLAAAAAQQDDALPESRHEISAAVASFLDAGRGTLDLLESDQVEAAADLHGEQLEDAYRVLTVLLSAEQEVIAGRIDQTEDFAGQVGAFTRFAVMLLIPGLALIIYRRIARRQLREEQTRMEAMLEAERELSRAKDAFIAGLSHELRTPLTSIYGFSEVLIESGLVDPEMSLELIALINHESAELSRMVEDLLTAARLDADALTYEVVPVQFAEELKAVAAPMSRAGAQISLECPPDFVQADQLRLRQVLRNLLSNAVRHGGQNIQVTGRAVDGSLECSVIDDGRGVPADIEDRLFERFVHEGREALLAGSVGLGLAIARSLTEAMGGDLRYKRVDGGTHFILSMPLADPALAPIPSQPDPPEPVSQPPEEPDLARPPETAPAGAAPPAPPPPSPSRPIDVSPEDLEEHPTADPWELAEV